MSDNKKYYYIKLKDNYFDQDNIKILESVPNGHVYSLIIVKLYLKATKYGGQLRMTESIPYDPSKLDILANVLNHDVAHVKEAIKLSSDLGIISILDTGDMWMAEIQNFIGQSSSEADRIRQYRSKLNKVAIKDKSQNVQMYDKSTPKREIEKEIELKIDTEKELKPKKSKSLSLEKVEDYLSIMRNKALYLKIIEFYHYRKEISKPLKTLNPIKGMINNIGSEFVNEQHLIQCIDETMSKEWQGVKGEYVKYQKPVEELSIVW